jgi:hypothetical protein
MFRNITVVYKALNADNQSNTSSQVESANITEQWNSN